MPSLLGYVERFGKLPKDLTFSIAALLAFYKGSEIKDGALIGNRNGEEYKIHGRNYTSSDDALCTRTNLYNEWVSADALPEDARTKGGGLTGATPCVFDQNDEQLKDIKTLEITFEYTPGEDGISPNDANSKN